MKIELKIMPDEVNPESQICLAVDVLRAFTTTRMLFHHGVETIRITNSIQSALKLRNQFPKAAVVGEKHGIKYPEADLQNSPSLVESLDKNIKTIILVTTNGTPALMHAPSNRRLYGVGLRDLHSIKKMITKLAPEERQLTTVLASSAGSEDVLFYKAFRQLIEGHALDPEQICRDVMASTAAQKFTRGQNENFPYNDLVIASTLEENPTFVQACELDEIGLFLRREYV